MKPFSRPLICLATWLLLSSVAFNQGITPVSISDDSPARIEKNLPKVTGSEDTYYQGKLRVYMVEPVSRWQDYQGSNFQFGFLAFALVTDVTISSSTPWQQTVTWNANQAGFGSVTENNIMAQAVLFNANGEVRDAVPPEGYWFTMYPVDAAAAAMSGNPGSNRVSPGYTHTVFAEVGVTTT